MHVIIARNVNDAYAQGLSYLRRVGVPESSRAGAVLVAPAPVTTVYTYSSERVLFCPRRDSNPFFSLFESLHMLAGRNDARWLDRFVRDFSSRFAEDDGRQHGAYGFRWRRHFDVEGGGRLGLPDQLDAVVCLLRQDPNDRQVVLTMWDPVADLGVPGLRDRPCNTHAYLRVRREEAEAFSPRFTGAPESVLDLTVCCRSNDVVWGAYGANAVHFSVLQEYLAGRIGVGVGRLYQISNNFHGYVDVLDKVGTPALPAHGSYPGYTPMGVDWEHWDEDLSRFMEWTEVDEPDQQPQEYPRNPWFHETAEPMFVAHMFWKQKDHEHALEVLDPINSPGVAPDWRLAAAQWMQRRMK